MHKLKIQWMLLLLLCSTPLLSIAGITLKVQSGHWTVVGEEGPGSGLNITLQNEQLALTLFTYDEFGQPISYFGSGQLLLTEISLSDVALFASQNGTPITESFSPAELVDTGKRLSITFTDRAHGQLTIDGMTKKIEYLRFSGPTVQIPGDFNADEVAEISDVEGSWVFIQQVRNEAGRHNTARTINLKRITDPDNSDLPAAPSAPILYADLSDPNNPFYFFCRAVRFDDDDPEEHPMCGVRFFESFSQRQYTVVPGSVTPERFEIDVIFLGNANGILYGLRLDR
ncbi:MAG: hypothetical protein MI750_13020 [Xanthomonadales bacterium]|nr:hypothetical protein [Xanthomonadales bacterium]